jgi:hypothetical protein
MQPRSNEGPPPTPLSWDPVEVVASFDQNETGYGKFGAKLTAASDLILVQLLLPYGIGPGGEGEGQLKHFRLPPATRPPLHSIFKSFSFC